MLESWPVSRRINSGFLILTLMLVGLAVFSQRSVDLLGNGYSEYRNIAQQNISIGAFVENTFQARIAASEFRSTPSPILRQEVLDNLDEVIRGSVFLEPFANNQARLSEVERLVGLARQYRSNFTQMSDKLEEAQTLHAQFQELSAKIKTATNALFAAAVQSGIPSVVSAAGRTLQSSLTAVVQSKVYFASTDTADLTAFDTEYASFESTLMQLKALNPQESVREKIGTLDALLAEYPILLSAHAEANQFALRIQKNTLDQIGPALQDGLDQLAIQIVQHQQQLGPEGTNIVERLSMTMPIAGIIATLAALLAALVIGRSISTSITRLADTTDKLAAGDNETEIKGTDHQHELGRMARALNVFREAQIERQEASAERARLRAQQDAVVNTMQQELAHLAQGDLTINISKPFAPEYEDLRKNFNAAVEALHIAISKVATTSSLIGSTTSETTAATNELSQRTENQAATLEQTAAALDQLTASVRSAAEHAKSVDSSVNIARTEATKNGEVVAQAVNAMGEIEQSSKQMTQVVSVIDDIAFQTNLLALNAGVEAARAGESGKGFAVVASEVRALAQRSAEAAKEISELIENSSRHVQNGTQLVGQAGEALSEIITQVNDISSMTSQIATSAEEQSIGLSEINIGVNQLDQVTQQNAAMVQESLSRGDALTTETEKLSDLIRQFGVNTSRKPTKVRQEKPAKGNRDKPDALSQAITKTHEEVRPRPTAPVKQAAGNNAAVWEDF
jgi:methyl-accepting chemotaxis protein